MRQEQARATPAYYVHPLLDPFVEVLSAAGSEPHHSTLRRGQPSKKINPSPRPQHAPKPAPTPRNHNRSNRAFSPNFDVYETADAYVLEGDLPGVSDKKSIDIEFADETTLMIRGRVDRPVKTPRPAPVSEKTQEAEAGEKRKSLNPTVEDTDDEDDFTMVRTPSSSSVNSSISSRTIESEKKEEKTEEDVQEPPRKKFLISERTFGSYQRSFTFQVPVETEQVKATLEDGLLRVVVPKVLVKGVRTIEVEMLE